MTTPTTGGAGASREAAGRPRPLRAAMVVAGDLLPAGLLARTQVIGVCLLLILAAIIHPAPSGVGPLEALYAVTAAATMAAWAVTIIRDRHLGLGPAGRAGVAFVAVLILSIAWALPIGTSLSAWARGLVPFLNLLLVLPLVRSVPAGRSRELVVGALALAAMIVAAQTYWTTISLIPVMLEMRTALIVQHYAAPNAYSAILVGMGAYSLGAALSPGDGRRRHAILLGLLLPAILLTFLKTLLLIFALLGLALGVAALRRGALTAARHRVAALPRRRQVLLVAAATAGVLLLVAGPGRVFGGAYLAKFAAFLGTLAEGNTRTSEYAAVLEAWSRRPVLGNGLGYEYSYFRPELGTTWSDTYTHNLLSYALLTAGVLGLAVALVFLVRVVRHAWEARGSSHAWAHGAAAAAYGLIGYAMLQATYRSLGYWLVFAVVVALLDRQASLRTAPGTSHD